MNEPYYYPEGFVTRVENTGGHVTVAVTTPDGSMIAMHSLDYMIQNLESGERLQKHERAIYAAGLRYLRSLALKP